MTETILSRPRSLDELLLELAEYEAAAANAQSETAYAIYCDMTHIVRQEIHAVLGTGERCHCDLCNTGLN